LLYSADGTLVDQVWYRQLVSVDGSVQHTGDNTTGEGEGDLESIRVDLSQLPEAVTALVFTVNSYTLQRFSEISAASCRLVDETYGEEELGSFNLSASGPHTAQIMAKLSRAGSGWTMTAIGSPAGGRRYEDLLTVVAQYVGGDVPSTQADDAEPVFRVGSLDVDGLTTHYRELGDPDAPAVVLLHGGGSSAATWNRLAIALAAAGRRGIAIDLRGHGGSARTPAYPLTAFCDDVLGVLDVLGLDRIALVGHSLGAHTASLIAQQQPERVTHLVLEELPAPARDPAERQRRSIRRLLLPAVGLFTSRRGFDPKAVTSAIRQLRVPDPAWWQRLSAITASTLLISGGPRSHVSPQRLAEVAEAIERARLITIPVGHRVHSHDPEQFNAAVLAFLATGG
jgi:pimeloyl-ACP methyl ester carboxylesterase/stress response protein SCP2